MRFERKRGIYEKYVKRMLDIICAVLALVVFGWLYIIVAILVRVKLGSPILFTQLRPGLIDPKTNKERVFKMYKFRTMTEARDESGNYLPDEMRLTRFGRILRATSLDELPEAINILRGEMSVIGPRPQLVRDMVFMSEAQRKAPRGGNGILPWRARDLRIFIRRRDTIFGEEGRRDEN